MDKSSGHPILNWTLLPIPPRRLCRKGRAAVPAHFAARRVIYPDASFAAKFARPARVNIARELKTLLP
jgi:hypothetical protein